MQISDFIVLGGYFVMMIVIGLFCAMKNQETGRLFSRRAGVRQTPSVFCRIWRRHWRAGSDHRRTHHMDKRVERYLERIDVAVRDTVLLDLSVSGIVVCGTRPWEIGLWSGTRAR